jgi:hypothetical protein
MSLDVVEYCFCPTMQNLYDSYISSRYSEFGLSYFKSNIISTIDRMIKHISCYGRTCICDRIHAHTVIRNAVIIFYEEQRYIQPKISKTVLEIPKENIKGNIKENIKENMEGKIKEQKKLSKSSTLNPAAKVYVPRSLSYSL